MELNWYPGHMTKASRLIEDNIGIVDAVIYVLDARCPAACINEHFDALIGNKPIIYALNKADMVESGEVSAWLSRLTSDKTAAVALDSTRSGSGQKIIPLIVKLLEDKIKRHRDKGVNYAVKAMVIGVPNTGKSTLINNLCGKARALAGNKPGVTKGKQWVRVNNNLELLDMPGVLKPKLHDQRLAYHLAFCGSIKDEVLDTLEAATRLAAELSAMYPASLKAKYGSESPSLEDIARFRGFLLKGGLPDIERAAAAILDDFRKGRIGKLILERAQEL